MSVRNISTLKTKQNKKTPRFFFWLRSAFFLALNFPGMFFLHHVVVFFIEVIDLLAVGVARIFNVIEGLKEDSVEGRAGRERKKGKEEGREGEEGKKERNKRRK